MRSGVLLLGVILFEMAFVVSYLGAFHSPTPHRIPLAVLAPARIEARTVAGLNRLPGDPLAARPVADAAQARGMVLGRSVEAALLLTPRAPADRLLLASAGGPSAAQTVSQVVQRVRGRRPVKVVDLRPPNPADGRGLSSFYLMIGLIIGGYVASSALSMSFGARPANPHRTVIRLGVLAVTSVVSGLGAVIIVDPVFSALTGHFFALWGIATLATFAAATSAMAFQVLLGPLGIALSMLLFVVLGNPSAGGVYPSSLLPPFWAAIGQALPNGATVTLVRDTAYFDGHHTATQWWVLSAWAAGGLLAGCAASLHARAQHTGSAPTAGNA